MYGTCVVPEETGVPVRQGTRCTGSQRRLRSGRASEKMRKDILEGSRARGGEEVGRVPDPGKGRKSTCHVPGQGVCCLGADHSLRQT